eukprot:11343587-Alexandrium_andersonii.AAC.1
MGRYLPGERARAAAQRPGGPSQVQRRSVRRMGATGQRLRGSAFFGTPADVAPKSSGLPVSPSATGPRRPWC